MDASLGLSSRLATWGFTWGFIWGFGRHVGCFQVNGRRRAFDAARIRRRINILRFFLDHPSGSLSSLRQISPDSTFYRVTGRKARSNAPNNAFSSGEAATMTCVAPASRTTEATPSEIQHCGTAKAEISTPALRDACRNARALRRE